MRSSSPNPFIQRGLVHDPAFFVEPQPEFDRADELLRAGQNLALIGDWRIGKSSFLHQLSRRASAYADRTAWVSLQAYPAEADAISALVSQLGGTGDSPADLLRAAEGASAAMFLDEIERATDTGYSDDFPGLLRSLAEQSHVRLAVASRRPLHEVFGPGPGRTSPLNNLHAVRLRAFAHDDCVALVNRYLAGTGLTFDAAEIDALMELTDGHPFGLQLAAFHLFEGKVGGAADWQTRFLDDPDRESATCLPSVPTCAEYPFRVFVSSVMLGMGHRRQAVVRLLQDELRLTAHFAEGMGSRPTSARAACLDAVTRSHLYLGIFCRRHGYVAGDTGHSATEEEYEEAGRLGIPRLLYAQDCPDDEREPALMAFLQRAIGWESGHMADLPFRNTADLVAKARRDLLRELRRLALSGIGGAADV